MAQTLRLTFLLPSFTEIDKCVSGFCQLSRLSFCAHSLVAHELWHARSISIWLHHLDFALAPLAGIFANIDLAELAGDFVAGDIDRELEQFEKRRCKWLMHY